MKSFFSKYNATFVIIATLVIAAISLFYYLSRGYLVLYGDTRTHLNIARRVLDNTNPGLAQLGGVWLPLLHILMLPFIQNDFLWHSGLAGSIVNLISLFFATIYLWKIGKLLWPRKIFIHYITPFFYLLNPNLLYLSTTAMTEVLYIATFTASIYYLLLWSSDDTVDTLIKASFFTFLTSINRYEGWAIAVGAVSTVFLTSLYRKNKFKKIEGSSLLFSLLALLGGFYWIIWNIIIFHSPLYFLKSVYSSKLQTQAVFAINGTKSVEMYKNVFMTSNGYLLAMMHNAGHVITIVAFISLLVCSFLFLISLFNKKRDKSYALIIFTLISPLLFEFSAIFNGNVPLNVPELTNGLFNIRLGMYAVPTLTILIFLFIRYVIKDNFFVCLVLVSQLILFLPSFNHPITFQAGMEGVESKQAAALWLKQNYRGGKILASSAVNDVLMFDSGIYLSEFITDGSQSLFTTTLSDPAHHALYLIISNQPIDRKRDLVYIATTKNMGMLSKYRLVFNNPAYKIYQLK